MQGIYRVGGQRIDPPVTRFRREDVDWSTLEDRGEKGGARRGAARHRTGTRVLSSVPLPCERTKRSDQVRRLPVTATAEFGCGSRRRVDREGSAVVSVVRVPCSCEVDDSVFRVDDSRLACASSLTAHGPSRRTTLLSC